MKTCDVCLFTKQRSHPSVSHYVVQTAENIGIPLLESVPSTGLVIAYVREMKSLYKKGCLTAALRIDKETCSKATFELVNCKSEQTHRCFWILPWPIKNIKPRKVSDGPLRIAYVGSPENMDPFFLSPKWTQYVSRNGLSWTCKFLPEQWNDYSDVDVAIAVRRSASSKKPPTKLINAWNAGVIPITTADKSICEIGSDGANCLMCKGEQSPDVIDGLIANKHKLDELFSSSKATGEKYNFEFVRSQWLAAIERMCE